MKTVVGILLAAASCCGSAEPLFQPDERAVVGSDATTLARIRSTNGIKSAVPIKINPSLLYSTSLDVEYAGKTYHMTGKVFSGSDFVHWIGDGKSSIANVMFEKATGRVSGGATLDGRRFGLFGDGGNSYLVELPEPLGDAVGTGSTKAAPTVPALPVGQPSAQPARQPLGLPSPLSAQPAKNPAGLTSDQPIRPSPGPLPESATNKPTTK